MIIRDKEFIQFTCIGPDEGLFWDRRKIVLQYGRFATKLDKFLRFHSPGKASDVAYQNTLTK